MDNDVTNKGDMQKYIYIVIHDVVSGVMNVVDERHTSSLDCIVMKFLKTIKWSKIMSPS